MGFSVMLFGILVLLSGLFGGAHGEERAPSVAVLPFELIDTSLQGEVEGSSDEEAARLALITALLRDLLSGSDRFRLIEAGTVDDAHARVRDRGCNDCAMAAARELGADAVIDGTVRKVSNLILSITIKVRAVGSGALIDGASADIRGNTDRSWSHGVTWLVRHRLLDEPWPAMGTLQSGMTRQ